MQTPISIRVGEHGDASVIAEFMLGMAWETERISLDRAIVLQGVENAFKDPKRGFYIVATSGEQVVACMMITYEWSDWRNGNQWWIQSVYVAPSYRRRGIFSQLFEFVKQLAMQERNVCGVRLYVEKDNAAAMETYRSLGMESTNYIIYEVQLNNVQATS